MLWFVVPQMTLPADPDAPAWEKVPSYPINNFLRGEATGHKAEFQLAWDKENLYLRLDCQDSNFIAEPELWNSEPPAMRSRHFYDFDGCVEVYFDCYANARGNLSKGHDQDDYRFDFYAKDGAATSGSGSVCRLYKVFHQLAGGLTIPTDAEAAKGVKCQFRRDGNHYRYVMIFPKRQIMPLELVKGYVAGFGLYIHDKEPGDKNPHKGLSLAIEPGAHCNFRPDLVPLMILGD